AVFDLPFTGALSACEWLSFYGADDRSACADLPRRIFANRPSWCRPSNHSLALLVLASCISAGPFGLWLAQGLKPRPFLPSMFNTARCWPERDSRIGSGVRPALARHCRRQISATPPC